MGRTVSLKSVPNHLKYVIFDTPLQTFFVLLRQSEEKNSAKAIYIYLPAMTIFVH